MCGIFGFFDRNGWDAEGASGIARRMASALRHRGPDDQGFIREAGGSLVIGHTRLSIIDVSSAGHQPMESASGRFCVAFNGEIYNHLELRSELERSGNAPEWKGHSDTETFLACVEAWGVNRAVESLAGMYAISLWDRQEQQLFLVRDRFGEKPIYYGFQGEAFMFGSELKALKQHPRFQARIQRSAICLLMRFNCIPAPYSIYENVHKLLPGHVLRISRRDLSSGALPDSAPYWSVNQSLATGLKNRFQGTEAEAISEIETQLLRVVERQMLSDVPLGAFLSGGVDSSLIVALMQRVASQPVRTFTIGSTVEAYDEGRHAREVARFLGTSHTELYVSPSDALSVIPSLPSIYCEPFSDSSQIPTFLVSRLASASVKVALSGDAGDEVFGGYNRYKAASSVWELVSRLPLSARQFAANLLGAVPPASWDRVYALVQWGLPRSLRHGAVGDKLHKLAGVLAQPTKFDYYAKLVSHWDASQGIVLGAEEPSTVISRRNDWPATDDFVEWMMAMDAQTYLPNDILVKVDRAAMANGLETRAPFLDHGLFETMCRMPLDCKIRKGETKWILRQLLYKYVPRELIERPKMGFGVPIEHWLRGELKEWASDLLSPETIQRQGFLDADLVAGIWSDHLSGKRNWQYHLWDVLMFQAWLYEEQSA